MSNVGLVIAFWRFNVLICNLSLDLRWIFRVCSMQICMRLLCVLRRFVCVLCTTPSFSLWFSTGMCGRFSNYARWVLEDRFEWILCWIVPPIDNYAEAPMESRIMPQIVLASGGRPNGGPWRGGGPPSRVRWEGFFPGGVVAGKDSSQARWLGKWLGNGCVKRRNVLCS